MDTSTQDDTPAQRVRSGESWNRFCTALQRAGAQVLRADAPDDTPTRTEGWRYLTRLLRIGLEMHVEAGTPEFPVFMAPSHETAKIGADNPDMGYQAARIDGRLRYRVWGTRGTVSSINFATKRGGYEAGGRLLPSGFIDSTRMQFDEDGSFELTLSSEPQPGNWLKTDPDVVQLLVRQVFLDRGREQPAQIRIECLDRPASPPPLSAEQLDAALQRAAGFVENTSRLFGDWAAGFQSHVNLMPPADQASCQAVGGDPNIFYYHSAWRLADDEALLLELDRIPACEYWNVQVDNHWMESLDYRWFRIAMNKHSARLEADGGVRIAIAHHDPGIPNWLQTAGHEHGTLCWRWIGCAEPLHPRTRVIKLAALDKEPR